MQNTLQGRIQYDFEPAVVVVGYDSLTELEWPHNSVLDINDLAHHNLLQNCSRCLAWKLGILWLMSGLFTNVDSLFDRFKAACMIMNEARALSASPCKT